MAGRPTQNELSKKITTKFNMTMREYAAKRSLSYASLRMFVSGIYADNKKIKEQLISDGILNEEPK